MRQAASFDVPAEADHAQQPSRDCERGNSLASTPSWLLRARDGDIRSHVGAHLPVPKKWSKVCTDGGI